MQIKKGQILTNNQAQNPMPSPQRISEEAAETEPAFHKIWKQIHKTNKLVQRENIVCDPINHLLTSRCSTAVIKL